MKNVNVEAPVIAEVAPGPQLHAAARCTMYRQLGWWLGFPWEDFHAAALAAEIAAATREWSGSLPWTVAGLDNLCARLGEVEGGVEADYDLFQSAYVGLFDVGAGGPPCPLYGGSWAGDRQKTMEEALRFYRFFGLTISTDERELPDHVTTQMEFLHFACFKEAGAVGSGNDAGQYRRATRDFLARHPARWLPLALQKLNSLDDERCPPFWHALLELAGSCCSSDLAWLVASEGPVEK